MCSAPGGTHPCFRLERFSKVNANWEEQFIQISSTGLRAGGLFSNKSTGSALLGRQSYRFIAMHLLENVKTFENHYIALPLIFPIREVDATSVPADRSRHG